jgi:hemolysin activation/secretion protein
VTTIEITGNTQINTKLLHELVKDAEGQDLTLSELSKVVARITEHYRHQGFPLARAIVPSQTVVAGILQVQVIEARYDVVMLDNQSPVNEALLRSALTKIKSGQVIQQAQLDQSLLSLADIPGVVVNATMNSGANLGATNLEVATTAASARVFGNSVIDNYGNAYVGRTRVSQSLRMIDPFRQQMGAVLDINGLSSGKGLNYGRVAYETILIGAVSRLGAAYSALQYNIGGPLASSGSHGDAQVFQVWARQSLLRSYTSNLSSQIQYDNTQLRDYSGDYIENIRHTDKITASLTGYTQDGLWLGGVNNWNLSLANGAVSFDNATAQSANASITDGRFTKLNGNLSRLQNINATDSLYVSLSLQWANQNLDSSEKMAVGGANNVRAADASALSGDMGSLFTIEYRHGLGKAFGGNWELTAFMDSATVQINKNPFGTNENLAHLSGKGISIVWYGPKQILVKAQLAKSLGTVSAPLATAIGSMRGWLEISHAF